MSNDLEQLGDASESAVVTAPVTNRGAKRGNTYRQTHGIHSFVVLGALPRDAIHIRRVLAKYRDLLEREVAQRHQSLDAYRSSLIQSACRHEGRALLLQRWLRKETHPLADRLQLLQQFGAATDSRDKCLKALGLHADIQRAAIDALYRDPAPDAADEALGDGASHERTL